MSEKLLLNAIMMLLHERGIFDDSDVQKIQTVRDVVILLEAKGVLSPDVADKKSKELISIVMRIKKLYEKRKLSRKLVEEMRGKHSPLLSPFFDFIERDLV